MNIRLMGEENLVKMWAEELERAYGVAWKYYGNRGSKTEGRVYINLDDRIAEFIINPQTKSQQTNQPTKKKTSKKIDGKTKAIEEKIYPF